MTPSDSNVITYWTCSSRCWQEGGPHDDDCRPTHYVRADAVLTDADRAVLDAADKWSDCCDDPDHDGAHRITAELRTAVRARREAQT